MGQWQNDIYYGDDGQPDWEFTNSLERFKPGAPFGPHGIFSTQDPLDPNKWYADDPNVVGGMVHFDDQGNILNTFSHGDARYDPRAAGGTTWDLRNLDPQGNPTQTFYPVEEGGLGGVLGVPEGWGALIGALGVLGAGFGLAAGASALGLTAGTIGVGGAGAGTAGTAGAIGGALPFGAEAVGGGGFLSGLGGAGAAGAGAAGAGGALGGAGALGTAAGVGGGASGLGSAVTGAGFLSGATGGVALGTGTGFLGALGPYLQYAPLIQSATGLIGAGIGAGAAKSAAATQAAAADRANQMLLSIYQQNRADLAPYRNIGYGALADLTTLTANPLSYGPYSATPTLDPSQYQFNAPPNFDPSQYQFTPPSGQQVLNEDPGYQFRVQQGMKALEQTGAARGGLVSGGQMKAAQQFGQDLASQEYQNAWQRAFTRQGFN